MVAKLAEPRLVSEGALETGEPFFRYTTPDRTIRFALFGEDDPEIGPSGDESE